MPHWPSYVYYSLIRFYFKELNDSGEIDEENLEPTIGESSQTTPQQQITPQAIAIAYSLVDTCLSQLCKCYK